MKITTVTFHHSVNYGAVLQAYALQKALEKCGYETELLDYAQNKATVFFKVDFRNPKKALKQIAQNILILPHYKDRLRMFQRFAAFKKQMKFTKYYETYAELEKDPPQTDVVLVGSDQVWNVTYSYRKDFFAEFAPSTVKKASYAASIGNYKYNDEKMKMLEKGVSEFSSVSVRENSAAKFLYDNFRISAETNIDPVFLLTKEEWSAVAVDPKIDGEYILCYALTRNQAMQEAMNEFKKKTGCKIVVVSYQPAKFAEGDVYVFDAGPAEFIGYVKNARAVFTTSFHGTAFSAIFNKDFYNCTIDFYSSRTKNLLEILGLEQREIKTGDDFRNAMQREINYAAVNESILREINKSYAYLRRLSASPVQPD